MTFGCTTQTPNHNQPYFLPGTPLDTLAANGQMALKFFWQQAAYNGTRMTRGAEICAPTPTQKEAWVGFSFYIPSAGYPYDKSAGMFQIFQTDSVCSSWAGHMQIVGNSLVFDHRDACVTPTRAVLMAALPRDTWIPVIVHMVASGRANGRIRVWVNGAPKSAPTYSVSGIDFGWRDWNADDTLAATNPIGFKFGQYDYDASHYTVGETRTSYYDNIHVIPSGRADGWEAVNPAGASFATSVPLTAARTPSVDEPPGGALFDDDPHTGWRSTGDSTWILHRPGGGVPRVATGYSLTSSSSNPERDPRNWLLKASNDGVSWITLDARNAQDFASRLSKSSYSIANIAAFAYYRLDVTAVHGGSAVQIGDWGLTYAP